MDNKVDPYVDFDNHQDLLDEVTGLCEWPTVHIGEIDKQFMKLPEEVIITAMVKHQRYFPMRDRLTGKLLPFFAFVANIDPKIRAKQKLIREAIKKAEENLRAVLNRGIFIPIAVTAYPDKSVGTNVYKIED